MPDSSFSEHTQRILDIIYQNRSGVLVFRYDNAAHKPPLPQPEHKHSSSGIETSPAPTFESVIDEILG